jgi:polyisoprenoid-binding protein YceI
MKLVSPALVATAALLACGLARAENATYAIDPTHTFVTYEMPHFGTSTNRGRFQAKPGGTVQIDRAAKHGSVDVSFDLTQVSTGVPALDKHLQSDEFFNVAKYPTATFKGDHIGFDGDKVSTVSGTLTFLGKSNPVTLKADHFNCYTNPMAKREVCGGDFEATIQRGQWGMTYGENYGFPDAVHLLIQVEAMKQ